MRVVPKLCLALAALTLAACGGDEVAPPRSDSPSATPGVPIAPGQVQRAIVELDELATRALAETGIPGLAIAVVHEGRTVYARGFGERVAGGGQPIDADTVFQLASVSKSVGATVVAHEVGEGRVAWDTPVRELLPWFRLNDDWVTQHVTVGDLYAHRSGLPDHAGDELEDLGYDRRGVLERLRELPLGAFRIDYAYTNFGLTAAAEAVAQTAGMDWAELSEAALYRPLGMTSTSSRLADFLDRPNRAHGHVRIDGTWQPRYQRRPDAQAPAGGVSSSARDMARWMTLVLGEGQYEGRRLVDAAALLPALSPQSLASPPASPQDRAGAYGFGFNVGTHPSGRTQVSHSGAFLLGAGTNFMLVPSAELGIVVLTNAAPIGAAEAIAATFTDLALLGYATRDWFAAYRGALAPVFEPTGELAGQSPPAEPRPARAAPAYTGRYANPYFGPLEVTEDGGRLVVTLGPASVRHELMHWDGDLFAFDLSGENAPPGSRSAARFDVGPNGMARTLTLEYYDDAGLGTFTRE